MISVKFLWGNVLLGGKLQIGAKNSNFEIFESALYMKSVSMPLRAFTFTCSLEECVKTLSSAKRWFSNLCRSSTHLGSGAKILLSLALLELLVLAILKVYNRKSIGEKRFLTPRISEVLPNSTCGDVLGQRSRRKY